MNMIHTIDVDAPNSDSPFILVDVNNQPESAKHGDRIGEEYIEALFGRDYIAELQAAIKEGVGEAAYIKGGRFSQIANFPLLRMDGVERVVLGDIDTKLVGEKTVSAMREKYPNRELRNQIAKYKLNDGQEVEFQDCEKVMKDTRVAIADALKQISEVETPLSDKQLIIKAHAEKLQEQIITNSESVLLSNGLNRAKEAAIKVVNVGGKLEYYLCDPLNSLGDPDVFDRERYMSDQASFLLGKSLLVARSLPNISSLSIHRLVIEMTTEFGHFDTDSPIVMTTLPLVVNIIQSEILEQMIFAADGLVQRTSIETKPEECRINRALESFALMKNFLAVVSINPNYANVTDAHVQQKVGAQNFAEYNKEVLVEKVIQALEMDAPVAILYIFSYFPALANVLFPGINELDVIQEYHNGYDAIDQNMLDMYISFDIEGETSPYINEHQKELNFFRNVQQICNQVFPYGDKVALSGSKTGQVITSQLENTPSVAKVIAVLLLSAGIATPNELLLKRIQYDWEKIATAQALKSVTSMDCNLTSDKILNEIDDLSKAGIGIQN